MQIIKDIALFCGGIILGTSIMFFAHKHDLVVQDKIIANLESKLKLMPVVTIDALGICSITNGGKSYMLIDVTNELRGIDQVDNAYRAPEQEIEEVK